ncbi:MAG: hypothetical protein IJ060_07215 [Oscillospiraceae bacterium]|nr:hypothetical protein [Oscillospiraceae bacterium]
MAVVEKDSQTVGEPLKGQVLDRDGQENGEQMFDGTKTGRLFYRVEQEIRSKLAEQRKGNTAG